MRFYAPPVTPESLYLQDKRKRLWDDHEREVTKALAENHAYWSKRFNDLRRKGIAYEDIAAITGMPEHFVLRHIHPFEGE